MDTMYTKTRYSIQDIQYYFICIPIIDISEEQQDYLADCFKQILVKHKCYLIDMSVKSDQSHLIFDIPLDRTLKDIINVLKSHSSFLLRKEYPKMKEYSGLWLKQHFISTIGVKNEKAVNRIMHKMKK